MSDVLLTARDGHVAVVTLHRPDKLNALNAELVAALHAAVLELDRDRDVRAVVLTGSGEKAFAAGADIGAMSTMSTAEAKAFSDLGHAVGAAIEAAHFPVIAAVNGFALGGGCELALACDWIVASDKAVFGQPEVNLGICPGFGGTQRLARVVGKSMALELVCTGRQVKADEALKIGIANHVVAAEALLEQGLKLARMVAQKGPVAVKMSKHLVQRGQDIDLANANAMEADVFGFLCATDDRREGMDAFLAKRPAKLAGR